MNFTISKMYIELSDIRLQLSMFWIKGCNVGVMICRQEHCCQENGNTSAKSAACRGLIKINMWNKYSDAMVRNAERIHHQSHPFKHFTNSSMKPVLCLKGEFPLLYSVWTELQYRLCECRATSNAYTEHILVAKSTLDSCTCSLISECLAWLLQNNFLKL
jgi:hypothetical protein